MCEVQRTPTELLFGNGKKHYHFTPNMFDNIMSFVYDKEKVRKIERIRKSKLYKKTKKWLKSIINTSKFVCGKTQKRKGYDEYGQCMMIKKPICKRTEKFIWFIQDFIIMMV